MTILLKLDVNFDVASLESYCLADVSIAIPNNIIAPKPNMVEVNHIKNFEILLL